MLRGRYSDEELINMIKAGGRRENRAIGYILKRNQETIKSLVLKNQGSIEDAEDVLQEGVVILISDIVRDKYKPDSSINTFLYTICKFIWYRKFGKKTKAQDLKQRIKLQDKDPVTPDAIIIVEELKQKLQDLALFLGEDCYKILYLSSYGYTMEEIMEQMPNFNSAQTIMNKKSKCKKKLVGEIEKNPDLKNYLRELRSFYFNDK